MADEGDKAKQYQDQETEKALAVHRQNAEALAERLQRWKGICLACGTRIPEEQRFCDEYCAEDYRLKEHQRMVKGGT